ncbi:MAG TPA: pyruvate dehydrogenase (acetyl-transferring) E1 component subunit alpha [Polyangiaceae bacterium]|nr:pyruvate dehydrogenase (acetyl-transferring) E1 component subunit alpha [Polyangiaceae bacterium]
MLNPDELLGFYRSMFTIRRFEEEAARAYAQGKIGGFLHLYIGQEAIAAGAMSVMQERDYVFQTYRDHGTALARGMDPKVAMAELFGKDAGCSRGLGGSMHFFDPDINFLGGWAIVGGHLPVAAGTAFASKYRKDERVTICFFGEGATNIAGFHEGMSLAGLWKLPIVFVCENNEYAMGTPMLRTSPLKDVALKASGYGMPGVTVAQGEDVIVVRDAVKDAVDRARSGGGPTLLEIKTYRFRGHSMSDPAKYRTQNELDERKKQDPLLVLAQKLDRVGINKDELETINKDVDGVIAAALKFAADAEPARAEVMMSTVYATPPGG